MSNVIGRFKRKQYYYKILRYSSFTRHLATNGDSHFLKILDRVCDYQLFFQLKDWIYLLSRHPNMEIKAKTYGDELFEYFSIYSYEYEAYCYIKFWLLESNRRKQLQGKEVDIDKDCLPMRFEIVYECQSK